MTNVRRAFARFFGIFDSIREINDRYKTPRLKMTPVVRFAMVFLRVYLIFILIVLAAKFVSSAILHQ